VPTNDPAASETSNTGARTKLIAITPPTIAIAIDQAAARTACFPSTGEM
jgi:hypothetical protein